MASSLDFDWHDGKAASNLKKHGLSFADARRVFFDPLRVDRDSTRAADGEERRKVTGQIGTKLYTVVYTERGRLVWLISARRANRTEEKRYGPVPA
ncbi:BrnT family toxin [Phreatobacter sp.]|uniref:BrnT family toxin n=1 Tax=Phreatobacter sp. TaxID=1966341 RepID=UPI0022C55A7B|nr:BrnT family toxin [Phreatobacter sp.]MCZ8314035.1 BrnT family toxin [Phreatobacter sp.]